MGAVARLLRTLIQWGLFLGMIGYLGDATRFMFREASHAQQSGLVSLGKLNRALTK